MLEKHRDDTPQHFEIVEAVRIGTGIVGQEKPKEDEDEVLESESEPIDVAPGGVFGYDAGEEASGQEAEKEAGDYDGEGGCTPMGRGEVTHKGEHWLFVNTRTRVKKRRG